MNHVISIASDKGGVGKTASTAAIGYSLAHRGYKVLLIDSDPQGNLSSKFDFSPMERRDDYIGTLIKKWMDKDETVDIDDYIHHNEDYENIDIIISHQKLDSVYVELQNNPFVSTVIFQDIINEIKKKNKYDFILIDTRPALRIEVGAALVASDWVLIPILPTNDSIIGANDILEFMGSLRRVNPNLKTLGVFFNRVQGHTKAFQEIKPFVKESWEQYLLSTVIPQGQSVINAENQDAPVTKAFPSSKPAKAFESLVDEVLRHVL